MQIQAALMFAHNSTQGIQLSYTEMCTAVHPNRHAAAVHPSVNAAAAVFAFKQKVFQILADNTQLQM